MKNIFIKVEWKKYNRKKEMEGRCLRMLIIVVSEEWVYV